MNQLNPDSFNYIVLGEHARSLDGVVNFLTSNPILGYPILVVVMSIAAFLMYGWDKRQAKTDGWRVPEKRLHTLAFLGGWPGALFGQTYFRHKTQKSSFKVMTWLAAALHVGLIGWYFYSRIAG